MLLTKAGKAFAGVVVEDPALEAAAARIVKALKWRGPFELEFILTARGHMLIEMNPRFPAWVDFASQVGCNLPAATLDILRGVSPVGLARPQPGKLFIRHCVDLVGDIADIARLSVFGKHVGVGAGLSLETAS